MGLAAVWLLGAFISLNRPWWTEASLTADREVQDKTGTHTMCWMTEEFEISKDCSVCGEFELKSAPECSVTGFIEQVQCFTSKKRMYKSCRSASMEKQVFWYFVASMIAASVALSFLVVFRQRVLDRRALEKVRKQIESI